MARLACPARLPVGQGLDCIQPTDCVGQTKKRKHKPQKGNDKISSKSQKTTTGGARTPSDRSARDSVQACGQSRDLSKSVPRKELTMADGSIADTSSEFSKESSSSLSLSSSSSNDLSSNDESNLSSSSSNDLSSNDKCNQDEKSDDNASSEDCKTKNLDGLEVNLERCHEPNIDNLLFDKNAAQIIQLGHPLAKRLPPQLNLRPSAYQCLIYHGVFTSFQRHCPVSVEALDKAKEVIFGIKLLKVTRPNNNHVVKENQMVASWTKSKLVLENVLPQLQDDNVGEDSLSSQSIFDQDIKADGYLNSLVPLERLLTVESHANLQEIYMVLCKSVHDICVNLVINDTFFGIDENQSVIDTKIAENCATSALTNIDDIEFWDWAGRNQFSYLWYCNNISKSPMLQIAIGKALRKSCHDHLVSMEFFEGTTK